MSRRLAILILLTLPVALSACASVSFQRETLTSGTFKSSGFAFTIFSIDLPMPALEIARENASDANMANMSVEDVTIIPNLGPVDWLLDIIGFRYAKIEGTWGFAGE